MEGYREFVRGLEKKMDLIVKQVETVEQHLYDIKSRLQDLLDAVNSFAASSTSGVERIPSSTGTTPLSATSASAFQVPLGNAKRKR